MMHYLESIRVEDVYLIVAGLFNGVSVFGKGLKQIVSEF